MIHELSIFFFRKVNNTTMREFAILLIENVLKQLPKTILDEKMFFSFHPIVSSEVIQSSIEHLVSVASF